MNEVGGLGADDIDRRRLAGGGEQRGGMGSAGDDGVGGKFAAENENERG